MAEVRFFLNFIDERLKTPVIGDDLWVAAKKALIDTYERSTCLQNCINMLDAFESTNRTKFRTDLDELIKESSYDDYYETSSDAVFVSTIHKAKGREFDTVFLMIKNTFSLNDEERRKLYVALTRAKDALYIHYNSNIFDYPIPEIVRFTDTEAYSEPQEIVLQLTHRDVVLNFFKGKENTICKLRSGDALSISDNLLRAKMNGREIPIAKFSRAFSEKLLQLQTKGYRPEKAHVNFVVAWKGEEDTEETLVVLPTLYLWR